MTTTSECRGTDRYLAYELVTTQDPNQISTASDVHALGCIGLEVRPNTSIIATHITHPYLKTVSFQSNTSWW